MRNIILLVSLFFITCPLFSNDENTSPTLAIGSRVKISVSIVEVSSRFGDSYNLKTSQETLSDQAIRNTSISLPSLLSPDSSLGIIEGSFVIGEELWKYTLKSIISNGSGRVICNTFGVSDDGKTLEFNALTKEPYQTSRVVGTLEQLVVDFINVGTEAKITPKINPDNTVNVVLEFKISEILKEKSEEKIIRNFIVPTNSERRIKTDVTLKSEEYIVIGGLDQEKKVKSKKGIPFLRRIPILGGIFFSSREEGFEKTRLYVIVNVSPINENDIKLYQGLKNENIEDFERKGIEKVR